MKKIILIILFAAINLPVVVFSQEFETPLQLANYEKLTSYNDLILYLDKISEGNKNFSIEKIAESVESRSITAVKISSSVFGEDEDKLRVMIFAQQHGNEQSGKEGALLLLKRFAEGQLDKLLNKLDVIIVPQVNPDGSEKNKRRNGNDADLNRDHLLLLQPETRGLHDLFNRYKPEVTMDVHEYFPYGESWKQFGYIKTFDEQIGILTNLNVDNDIIRYSEDVFLPFISNFLKNSGYTFHNYIVGGPPSLERIRHSTVDINDGRQSLGIMNTLSFILEGKNGQDHLTENIKRRAEGQEAAMIGLLYFAYNNADDIKEMISKSRNRLNTTSEGNYVDLRMEHYEGGPPLELPLFSISGQTDTIVTVRNYHSKVQSLLDVIVPKGYLVPADNEKLMSFVERNRIEFVTATETKNVFGYRINSMDLVTLEEQTVPDPVIEKIALEDIQYSRYVYIPCAQIKRNMIVLAFEPRSMIGLTTYEEFRDMLEEGKLYPVLRVE